MGKATKWFRGLLGLKKSEPNHCPAQKPAPPKSKWSFAKLSHKDKDRQKSKHGGSPDGDNDEDASKHAIAVAAATAAVAEAAVAAAQAAAAVVELTSTGGSNTSTTGRSGGLNSAAYVGKSGAHYVNRDEWAAVMIQSHFRAYLSRRALKALRALVKLQALARGYIWRKRWGHGLRQMQALIRAQERARAGRALIYEASHLSTKGPATPEKFERIMHGRSRKHEHLIKLKRNGSKSNGSINFDQEKSTSSHPRMSGRSWDERTEKILEVDTGRPHPRRNISRSSHLSHSSDKYYGTTAISSSSGEVQSLSPLKVTQKDVIIDDSAFWTAENSPQFYSASSVGGSSSQRGAFTPPTKSLSGYSDHPNYMAYTQSSKAKVRSLSAPKQRQPQYERSSSINRYSVHGYGDLKSNSQKKCYPGSGRLDRFGLPVRDTASFSGGHWIGY